MLGVLFQEVQMSPGEIAFLSMAIAGFTLFAIVLFTVERVENRNKSRSRQRTRKRELEPDHAGALHA
jgi:hypothetical protein